MSSQSSLTTDTCHNCVSSPSLACLLTGAPPLVYGGSLGPSEITTAPPPPGPPTSTETPPPPAPPHSVPALPSRRRPAGPLTSEPPFQRGAEEEEDRGSCDEVEGGHALLVCVRACVHACTCVVCPCSCVRPLDQSVISQCAPPPPDLR